MNSDDRRAIVLLPKLSKTLDSREQKISAMNPKHIYSEVSKYYSEALGKAEISQSDRVAKAFGYTAEELSRIPADANLGLSCGNPLAIDGIREVCR